MVWEETDEETNDLKTLQCMARCVETCQMHRNVWADGKTPNRKMPGDGVEFFSLIQEMSSDASNNAL